MPGAPGHDGEMGIALKLVHHLYRITRFSFKGVGGPPGEKGSVGVPGDYIRPKQDACRQCPPGQQGQAGYMGSPGEPGSTVSKIFTF